VVSIAAARPGLTARGRAWRDPTLLVCSCVFVVILVSALTAPAWWSKSPIETNPLVALQGPSLAHPMGTDVVGRDMLARFLAGARISMLAAFSVAAVGGLLGSLLGLVGGLGWRAIDGILMRLFDAMLAFPPVIFAMAVTLALGVGLGTACAGVALSAVPYIGRVVRSDVRRVAQAGYVESARALGVAPLSVIRRHVLPHVMPTILVQVASLFSFSIISVAALGFVGLGAQIPTPEWGTTITEGSAFVLIGKWWVSTFPGIGLLVVTAASAVIADRIRALLDPRSTAHRSAL
jgi:peptide/nickel transport system permease protein